MQNTIEVQVGKWGNSLGIRLPKYVLEVLDLSAQDKLSCEIENGKLILVPTKGKYALEDLLSEVAEPSEEVSWGKPEGQEAW